MHAYHILLHSRICWLFKHIRAYKLFFLPIVAVTTATCAKVMPMVMAPIVVISSSHPSND